MSLRLTGINRFPVKSFRGEPLDESVVEPWGLAGDRRWMVVDPEDRFVTARECPAMLLVRPTITPTGLRLEAPGAEPLDLSFPEGPAVRVGIWSSVVEAPVAPASEAWLTAALGRPARLVHLGDPTLRATDPTYSQPGDRVSFADGYPLLLATEESLAALNDAIVETAGEHVDPLPMRRFRPNLVVAGAPAWAEDDWRRVRVGEAEFRAVKGCARCVMTTKDPDTAEGGKEPIRTLARIRRWDRETWFAINLVPDTPGATVRVGDEVEVLDAVPPGGGPLR